MIHDLFDWELAGKMAVAWSLLCLAWRFSLGVRRGLNLTPDQTLKLISERKMKMTLLVPFGRHAGLVIVRDTHHEKEPTA